MNSRSRFHSKTAMGFTMVEMLVAMLFTGLLMAGMARVYQGSLSTFTTTAERISAGRKGRIALDALSDDLNAAGLLVDWQYEIGTIQPSNPGFYIIPNRPVAYSDGTTASDELYFYYDQFVPFEGRITALNSDPNLQTVDQQIAAGTGSTTPSMTPLDITVKLSDASFASMINTKMTMMIGNNYGGFKLSSASVSGSTVRATTVVDETQIPTYRGRYGFISPGVSQVKVNPGNGDFNDPVNGGTAVFFIQTGQMVRYSVQARALDPSDPTHTSPVLMREQGNYSSTGFVASSPAQIVAEDVLQMQIYLSADGGKNWARTGITASDFSGGWLGGIVPQINSQLSTYGPPGHQDANSVDWFQANPMLIRVDLVTRTTTKRTENTTVAATASYNTQTRSLIMVPRHFGLQIQ